MANGVAGTSGEGDGIFHSPFFAKKQLTTQCHTNITEEFNQNNEQLIAYAETAQEFTDHLIDPETLKEAKRVHMNDIRAEIGKRQVLNKPIQSTPGGDDEDIMYMGQGKTPGGPDDDFSSDGGMRVAFCVKKSLAEFRKPTKTNRQLRRNNRDRL